MRCESTKCSRQPMLHCVHGWWCDVHIKSQAKKRGCGELFTAVNRLVALLQAVKVPDLEGAKVLLDEWKWRQDECGTVLRQYVIAAVTVSIAPYVKSDTIGYLGRFVVAFPILGWFLAVAAAWSFANKYVRSEPVEARYRQLLGRYAPDRARVDWFRKSLCLVGSTGKTTIWVLLTSSGVLSLLNLAVLDTLIGNPLPERYFWGLCFGCLALPFAWFLLVGRRWSKRPKKPA
jgi:hypothetical protein